MNIFKKIIFFFIFSITIISCNKVPDNVLSERKMIKVITDIAIVDGSISVSDYRNHEYEKKEQYYKSIFEKHNITPSQLESSLMWYSKKPTGLELIYEKVEANLEKKLANLDNKQKKQKNIK